MEEVLEESESVVLDEDEARNMREIGVIWDELALMLFE
jgi:hypothetical protein